MRCLASGRGGYLSWPGRLPAPGPSSRAELAALDWRRTQYRDKDFSFTDCTSLAVMRELRLTQGLSTDQHFDQMGSPCSRPHQPGSGEPAQVSSSSRLTGLSDFGTSSPRSNIARPPRQRATGTIHPETSFSDQLANGMWLARVSSAEVRDAGDAR
jgi:hypothetical protein